MLVRLHLVQRKPEVDPDAFLTALQQLHSLREEWPGISDISIGETTSALYSHIVILRYAEHYATITVVQTPSYTQWLAEISSLCLICESFDVHTKTYQPNPSTPLYGFFTPTLEERLRGLVALWFQGTGQQLTAKTEILSLPGDKSEVHLFEFTQAVSTEFDIPIDAVLDASYKTFGDLLHFIEKKCY